MTGRRPVLLGIIGDSAAGKTTLTQGLTRLLGPERVTHLCTDDYHKYDREERAQRGITALHPDCNYLDILELHLERLHYGQPILKPVYDHATGMLVRPAYLQPREFVIVEGLLGFHSAVMRQFYDVKVYLQPPEELRRVWKIRRDTAKRGLHGPTGTGRAGETRGGLARLHPPAAGTRRHRRAVFSAIRRLGGTEQRAPRCAAGAATHDSASGPDGRAGQSGQWRGPPPGARRAIPAVRWISWRSMAASQPGRRHIWRRRSGGNCPVRTLSPPTSLEAIWMAAGPGTAIRWR